MTPGGKLFFIEEGYDLYSDKFHQAWFNFISERQLQQAQHQGCKSYIVFVQEANTTQPTELPADLQALLDQFQDVFPEELPSGLPPECTEDFHINLTSNETPCKPIHHLGHQGLEALRKQLSDYLHLGFIKPSSSPYGAPVLFVYKKDGSLRMCVDYCAINSITQCDQYPIPHINNLLCELHGAKYFTTLDLASGYHQL